MTTMTVIGIRVEKKHFVLPADYIEQAAAIGINAGALLVTDEPVGPDMQECWIEAQPGVPPRDLVMRFLTHIGAPRPCPIQWADPVVADLTEMPNA